MPEELDFDPEFLRRYPPEELLADRVSFLHSSKVIYWEGEWKFLDKTALWNFNLHYFDYLLSLAEVYLRTGEEEYFDKTKQMISGWIRCNPREKGGPGWAAYTIALRLTNWLSYYAYLCPSIQKGSRFSTEAARFDA